MCGICGKVSPAGVQRSDIEKMAGALVHRGPDDEGFYVKGAVGLGHRRLSIIDLNTGKQPIHNEDSSLWVVLNGEIYNYRELREDLLRKGHRFHTQTDTEVIVHLYEEYGTACVKQLRGMFACAIWDEKRQRLFAARDRLGQKPFYYVQRGGEFLFASEIKALLAVDSGLAELNHEALDQYLTLRIIAPPQSMFQAIKKLPPAHWLTFEPQTGLQIERYWDLEYEPKLVGSEEDLVDALEERLVACLKHHMVSDVPVGAFLSGGLDSTLIVSLLVGKGIAQGLHTFSGSVPYGQYDEAPYARLVAEQYGTQHHEETIHLSLLEHLAHLVWNLDEPSDPLALCTFLIARLARRYVKVVLGGDGGDELFGGYDRYYGFRYAGYYAGIPRPLRTHVLGQLLKMVPDGRWYKSRGHQLKWLHQLSFLEGGARYAESLGYFYFNAALRQDLYGPAMSSFLETSDAKRSIQEAFDRVSAKDVVDKMLYADSQIRLPDHSVMILDRMTMAHGLEARSPFMDHELAEFAARLPVELKVKGRSLRYIQMKLAERYLPKTILARPKQGFSSALPYLLRDQYALLFDRFLSNAHLARDGVFRQTSIQQLLEEHQAGVVDHGNRLWLLLNSEVWYRMTIEQSTPRELTEEITEQAKAQGLSKEQRAQQLCAGAGANFSL